jgi:hypothetical protein
MLFGNRQEKFGAIAFIACLSIFLNISSAVAQTKPANLDFEFPDSSGKHIGPPWFLGQVQQSYDVSLENSGAYHGKYWAHISSIGKPGDKEFANLMQTFNATPYRGKFIKYRAAAKHIGKVRGDARLWMRVDRAQKRKSFFTSKTDRPIQSTDWEEYQIIGYVPPDAVAIYIGCSLVGAGSIGFDAVTIDTVSVASGEPLHDFQMPELLTFQMGDDGTEDVKCADIDKITASPGIAVVTLTNGRQIHANGDYIELARYFDKSK